MGIRMIVKPTINVKKSTQIKSYVPMRDFNFCIGVCFTVSTLELASESVSEPNEDSSSESNNGASIPSAFLDAARWAT